MRKILFALLHLAPVLFLCSNLSAQSFEKMTASRLRLPNGWSLTPAGSHIPLGDLPLNIAVSPSRSMLAVTNNGQSDQNISLIDAAKMSILDTIVIDKSWYGLVFSADSRSLFASGGNDNWIIRYDVSSKRLVPRDTLVLGKPDPERISPAGIAVDDERRILYAVTKEDNSLYVCDIAQKAVTRRFDLGGEGYACLLSPDKNTLYVSCWGCSKILTFDTRAQAWAGSIIVGGHPNEMCLDKGGATLYVANANDNSVSVVDLKTNAVIEVLNTALYPDAPVGSTPNSVALSPDGRVLYVANADNNCLALFDLSVRGSAKSKGFIPTGWYPTSVRAVGGHLFVANGKGNSSFANPGGPNPFRKKLPAQPGSSTSVSRGQYIGGLFRGTLSMIPVPNETQLAVYSKLVYANVPYRKDGERNAAGSPSNPIPMRVGGHSPISHVFYIIKENRTYDQVLADAPGGNGDTSLLLFGRRITPNQHKLVGDFVLLDNFYADAEVSMDGHNWSLGAYATDFLEKTWPTLYGDRGGSYDGEGNREAANNKTYLWDVCKAYGISYRNYGEFMSDNIPSIPILQGHFCPSYTAWDLEVRDTTRFLQWKRDFDSLLAIDKVPQLSTVRLGNDHTMGLSLGKPTPFAQVADNDRAVGLFVEYLSHSSIWNSSAVFIVEDDAQAGPDHVDAHRTTAYVAGGYVKRGYADHTMYSTSSMLRTMELILGLPPMSQYDAAAAPMWRSFSDTALPGTFTAVGPYVNLADTNMAVNLWQKKSEEFDFTKEDRAPDDAFNRVLWFAVKGETVPFPSPRRSAFVLIRPGDED